MFDDGGKDDLSANKLNEVIYAIDGCLDECILIEADEFKTLSQTLELARFQKVLLSGEYDTTVIRHSAWRRNISGIDSLCVQNIEIFSSAPERNWLSGFTLVRTSVTFSANND
ncbi:MAG: hypothetical protein HN733_00550 [Gammaproteobacteria bacterium]|jgi:hypothetical protein|nr:hypothetical protein [Gammaproteobacteria bacterium]